MLTLRLIGLDDYVVREDGQRIGRIRDDLSACLASISRRQLSVRYPQYRTLSRPMGTGLLASFLAELQTTGPSRAAPNVRLDHLRHSMGQPRRHGRAARAG